MTALNSINYTCARLSNLNIKVPTSDFLKDAVQGTSLGFIIHFASLKECMK